MYKRLFDFLSASIGLLVLAPLFIPIAIWVALDSPGPIFFCQERIGRGSRPFRMYKFRSMQTKQAAGALKLTVSGDSRITRSGQFLRKTKLDELPQLINVVLGHMSLVGPRPEVAKYVALYSPLNREVVLSARPGITDLASIKFRNENDILAKESDPEEAYIHKLLPKKLRLCRYYVRRQSLCFDLYIIFRTFAAVAGRG